MYRKLLKAGWTLPEIDGMDISFYFELLVEDEEEVFIDQLL
jgi:hypothetical protein